MKKVKIVLSIGIVSILLASGIIFTTNNHAKAYSENSKKVITNMKNIKYGVDVSSLSKSELDEVVLYMETYPENVVPWNYTFTADYIFTKQENKEKAVLFYFIGLIRLQEDIKMCTSPFVHKLTLEEGLKASAEETMTHVYEETKKNKNYSYNEFMRALTWDETHKRFQNPAYACVIADYGQDIKPMSEYNKILQDYRKNMRDPKLWEEIRKEAEGQ